MLYPKIGDKIYNFGRTEIITDIKVRGPVRYYYTKTKRGSVNFFTDKDFCEQAIKDKRISTKKTTVDLLFGESNISGLDIYNAAFIFIYISHILYIYN